MAKHSGTNHGIDLNAPGGLEALFAFHKAQFPEGAVMEAGAGGDGEGTGGTGGDGAGENGGAGPEGQGDSKGGSGDGTDEGKHTDDKSEEQSYDQKYVSSLRNESAGYRTQRNEARNQVETLTGERDSLRQQLDAINKIFNPDAGNGDEVDADEITKANAQLKLENALLKVAPRAGGDIDRLTDSNKFMKSIEGIDPTDVDALSAKIKAAIQDNPALGSAPQGGRRSGGDLGGGSGEKDLTLDQFKGMSYEERANLYKNDKPAYDRLSAQL